MTNRSILALILILTFGLPTLSCGAGNHLVSIAVTPNPANLFAPATLQLQAVGKYSNGTTQVLSSATWTLVSPPPFVTLDMNGLVTCSGSGGPVSGQSRVIASFAGLSGSAMLVCSGPGV
jgi:hypothetical protein